MNIFQSVKIIFQSLSENYKNSRELQDRMLRIQESTLHEAKCKILLETQLREHLEILKNSTEYYAVFIRIATECQPFVEDVYKVLKTECTLTPGGEPGLYVLQATEEEF